MLIKQEGEKYNFIDSRDLFVGYDTSTDCCEDAGWFINDEPTSYNNRPQYDNTFNLEGYNFDIAGHVLGIKPEVSNEGLDEGGIVVFRLIHPDNKPLFLHLYNCHNGYYGHEVLSNLPFTHETGL